MKRIESNLECLHNYLCDYYTKNNYLPSVREMAGYLHVKSTSTVSYYLDILQKRGFITKSPSSKARAFELTNFKKKQAEEQVKLIQIPLVGTVTCGTPILAVENYESIYTFPENLFNSKDLFMLQAEGDSMINVGINSGDYIVVHKQATAENGEIVVAMIDYHATVKRFYREVGRFRLQPENDNMKPIYTNTVIILGKVVGLIRKMR